MKTILTAKQRIEIAYEYVQSASCPSMKDLSIKYGISPSTVSKILHESIENLQVPRFIAIKIRDTAVANIRKNKKSPYKTMQSFNSSIKIFDYKIKNFKQNLDFLCIEINKSSYYSSEKLNSLVTQYNKTQKMYEFLMQ